MNDVTQAAQPAAPISLDIPMAEAKEILSPEKVALFQGQLNELSISLEQALPGYKDNLKQIDRILKSYPEIAHVLSEDQIGLIVKGLMKEADLQFFAKEKKEGGGKKGKAKVEIESLDDI